MTLISPLNELEVPIVGSPLFLISNPDLVLAQCVNGVMGSFPALNAREEDGEPNMLEIWLKKKLFLSGRPGRARSGRVGPGGWIIWK